MSRKTRRNAIKNSGGRAFTMRAPVNRLAYVISGLTLGSMAFSGHLFAADAGPAATPASSDDLTEITVTGIKASIQKSLDIKQEAIGVVDAISAEDIGTFPDSNLAAAIQRIPGISVSRGVSSLNASVPTSTGAATEITVRGFGPAFNETLIDGRHAR